MPTKKERQPSTKHTKGTLWVSSVFYFLIAFEFFYMASPFAIYFYGVYGPGLSWLQASDYTSWTIQFFLPHLVEASNSPFISVFETAGYIMFLGGLIGFAIGAFQIYRAKLLRNTAVMGGLYRFIRHPQYLALIVSSIGMLFVWPRFLVLFMTVTVIFIYIVLAKTEEAICLKKYDGYQDYLNRTGMFLPRGWLPIANIAMPKGKFGKFFVLIGTYAITLIISVLLAQGIRSYTIANFYTLKTENSVFLSTVSISNEAIEDVSEIVLTSPEVTMVLKSLNKDTKFLNYVLPVNMYVSEIPMHLPEGKIFGHSEPKNWDKTKYKVILTKAVFGGSGLPDGGNVLGHMVNKQPLIEVWVDLTQNKVIKCFSPPKVPYYGNRQVPIF